MYFEVRANCSARFEFLPGVFHLLVLSLDLLVLLDQRPRLLLRLLVGLLQFFLASGLLGERLGLFEQVLSSHVGFDGVEYDADRLGQC